MPSHPLCGPFRLALLRSLCAHSSAEVPHHHCTGGRFRGSSTFMRDDDTRSTDRLVCRTLSHGRSSFWDSFTGHGNGLRAEAAIHPANGRFRDDHNDYSEQGIRGGEDVLSTMLRRAALQFAFLTTAVFGSCLAAASSAATPFSKDGEATVYIEGAFGKPFVVSFDAALRRQLGNRSWSTVAVSLLGGPPPSDSISIGLYPTENTVRAFFSVNRGASFTFRDSGVACRRMCRLMLRGSANTVFALVNGREVARWPRFEFSMRHPSVQLNGEVDALGDRLDARLRPVELQVGGVVLAEPWCSFTTRGINVRKMNDGTLRYVGEHRVGAPSVFVSLTNGHVAETCTAIR